MTLSSPELTFDLGLSGSIVGSDTRHAHIVSMDVFKKDLRITTC